MDRPSNDRDAGVLLVVDDDDITRMLARQFLGEAGFVVFEAEDGEQALKLAAEIEPNVMLLDVDLPGLDGFEVCTRLRGSGDWSNLPIMMLTSIDDFESIQRAYDAGATDFSTKPVNWGLLGHRLRYLLRSAETLLELGRAQRSATIGSWTWYRNGGTMSWSDQLYRILGLAPGNVEAGWALLQSQVPERDWTELADARSTAMDGTTCELIHRIMRPDGVVRVVRHRIESASIKKGRSMTLWGTLQDITDLHEASERVHRLAYYDPLTGLPNRVSFRDQLARAVATSRRHHRKLAVLYLDLDDFKYINDSFGHPVGDSLLRAAAKRLDTAVRDTDIAARIADEHESPMFARLGGDEFAVLLGEINTEHDVDCVASRILKAFSFPFEFDGLEILATPSIGGACFPAHGTDADSLLKRADFAMYEAKRSGKNAFRHYDRGLSDAAQRRNELSSRLHHAHARGELSLVYQPQMDMARDTITAAEALLRWDTEGFGEISPTEFIPLAEEKGHVVPIGEWVLHEVCRQIKAWREQGVGISRVSVNTSVKQFAQSNFVERVALILAKTGCDPACIELEITESVLATDADSALQTLAALKRLGVGLSIDDFGTGYSSLSYLKRFTIDRLKIDRSFVKDLVENPSGAAIVQAVIGIARGLGLKVVAEGVETDAQLRALRLRNCDEIQGYYLSPPCRPEELADLIKSGSSKTHGIRHTLD